MGISKGVESPFPDVQHSWTSSLDERKGSAGAKFKDSDLLGIPVRVTAGKLACEGIVELKHRYLEERIELSVNEVLSKLFCQ